MSVHGEFGRALQGVIAAVEMLPPEESRPHRGTLEKARLANQPNLEAAAETALKALERLSASGLRGDHLTQVVRHLDAHCRVILGRPSEEG